MSARAATFDLNGTLSHDEPIPCEVFCELRAGFGRELGIHALEANSEPTNVYLTL